MSVTVAISVDDSQVRFLLGNLAQGIQNIEEGLLEAAESTLIPELYDSSITVWNVRTGDYSSAWFSEIIGPGIVRVGNDVEYAFPLEWGWTMRNGEFKPSPGVLYPTTYSNIEAVVGELVQWLQSQIQG